MMDSTSLHEAEALGRARLTADEILESAQQLIRRRVPFDAFIAAAFDPLSGIPVRALYRIPMSPARLPRLLSIEMTDARHFNVADLPHRAREKAWLTSHVTGGALEESSAYYREIMRPIDLGHAMKVQLRASGLLWGGVCLLREARAPEFEAEEVELVTTLATPLAEALRRAVLVAHPPSAIEDSPAVVVLSADDRVVSSTDAAEPLLAELADVGLSDPERLPAALRAVALITRHPQSAIRPVARARTRSGSRLTVRGTALDGGQRVALVIEPSRPSESAWLTLAGYGLSPRECAIALHVVRGLSTEDVSHFLRISEYTVQDHLKAIFDKTGFSTRRELAARLFLDAG